MKYFIAILLTLCIFCNSQAQAPQGIPYQSVMRNGSGALLANQSVHIRFSIHDSTALGNIVYQETHATTTTSLGMVSLTIGQGTPVTGTFSNINWGNGAKFMQVELDTTAGNNYIDLGTQQMMSVPYALYAEHAGNLLQDSNYIFNKHGYLNLMNDTFITTKKDIDMEITMRSGKGGNSGMGIRYGTSGMYATTAPINSSNGGNGYKVKFLIKLLSGDTLYFKTGHKGQNGCDYCNYFGSCYPWYNIQYGNDGTDGSNSIISLNDPFFNNYILRCVGGSKGVSMKYVNYFSTFYNSWQCGEQNGQNGYDGYLELGFGTNYLSSSATILESIINNDSVEGTLIRW